MSSRLIFIESLIFRGLFFFFIYFCLSYTSKTKFAITAIVGTNYSKYFKYSVVEFQGGPKLPVQVPPNQPSGIPMNKQGDDGSNSVITAESRVSMSNSILLDKISQVHDLRLKGPSVYPSGPFDSTMSSYHF